METLYVKQYELIISWHSLDSPQEASLRNLLASMQPYPIQVLKEHIDDKMLQNAMLESRFLPAMSKYDDRSID